ncbi:MAG: TonB-dependent receptor plug domain-containing protein [Sandarakinorhabdus sp.]|nr:TonB-dependent receptor plug domain-containing protein [Sandarakinorhabdus sp.]
MAVTALNAAARQAARIEDSKDLQFNVPNVTLSANRNITIRGVGSASFGATNDTDIGVLYNRVFLQSGGTFGEFFDLESIEVLRGPQGTLFGRSTTGGAMSIINHRPTDAFEGFAEVQGESPLGVRVNAAINIPIAKGISQRFAVNYVNRDEYTDNLLDNTKVDRRNQYAVRSSTRFEPWEMTKIGLMLTYFKENSSRQQAANSLCTSDPKFGCSPDSASTAFPTSNFLIDGFLLPGVVRAGAFAPNLANLRDVTIDVKPFQKAENFLGTLEINQEIGNLNVGLIGYSMGGYGALATAGVPVDPGAPAYSKMPQAMRAARAAPDPALASHLKAVVALAPWGGQPAAAVWRETDLAALRLPILFIDGDLDDVVDFKAGVSPLFARTSGSDRYLLVYREAAHNIAGNPVKLQADVDFSAIEALYEPVWRKDRIEAINQHFILAFLDARLKGQLAKLLYLNVPTQVSDDGLWPSGFGQQSGGKTVGDDQAGYWRGFQRRWARGLEMHHKGPGE